MASACQSALKARRSASLAPLTSDLYSPLSKVPEPSGPAMASVFSVPVVVWSNAPLPLSTLVCFIAISAKSTVVPSSAGPLTLMPPYLASDDRKAWYLVDRTPLQACEPISMTNSPLGTLKLNLLGTLASLMSYWSSPLGTACISISPMTKGSAPATTNFTSLMVTLALSPSATASTPPCVRYLPPNASISAVKSFFTLSRSMPDLEQ